MKNKSAEPGTSGIDAVLREIYVLYSDCALVRTQIMHVIPYAIYLKIDFILTRFHYIQIIQQKDPFYELEMPIRCELFTNSVDSLVHQVVSGGLTARY